MSNVVELRTPVDVGAVLELRQYTLHPGHRDALVELFDRELVDGQEALGMQVVGQFRDLDDPDRFVWLRGFASRAERAGAVEAFYRGPVWARHGPAANATMVDWSDVHLLRPARARSGFDLGRWSRPDEGWRPTVAASVVTATIHELDPACDVDEVVGWFEQRVAPVLRGTGAPPLAGYVTAPAPDDAGSLPVHHGVQVLVCFSRFDRIQDLHQHERELARSVVWRRKVAPVLDQLLARPSRRLRLAPTPRSRLR